MEFSDHPNENIYLNISYSGGVEGNVVVTGLEGPWFNPELL